MGEHNAALSVDGHHPGHGNPNPDPNQALILALTQGTPNWEIAQWSGLVTSSVNFPELQNASGNIDRALSFLQVPLLSQYFNSPFSKYRNYPFSQVLQPPPPSVNHPL